MKPLSTNQSSTKPSSAEQVRLDKWLWVARFYKHVRLLVR